MLSKSALLALTHHQYWTSPRSSFISILCLNVVGSMPCCLAFSFFSLVHCVLFYLISRIEQGCVCGFPASHCKRVVSLNTCILFFRTVRGKLPFTRRPAQGASSASVPWQGTGLTPSKYLQLFLPLRDVVKMLYPAGVSRAAEALQVFILKLAVELCLFGQVLVRKLCQSDHQQTQASFPVAQRDIKVE